MEYTKTFGDLEDRVYTEYLSTLYSRPSRRVIYYIAVSVVLYFVVIEHVPVLMATIWLILSLTIHVLRYIDINITQANSIQSISKAKNVQRRNSVIALCHGSIMGLGAAYFFPQIPALNQMALIALLLANVCTLLVPIAAELKTFYLVLMPMTVPILIENLILGSRFHFVIAIFGSLFLYVICRMHHWNHNTLKESIRLRLINMDLAASLEQSNERLEELSVTDELTRIGNRRYFDQMLEREWSRARRNRISIAMIMMDIDHFKEYNDEYGHLEGDKCLIAIAGQIKSTVNRPGDFAARYGGEEFAVVLSDTDSNGAEQLAKSIQEHVSNLNIEHKRSHIRDHVTLSFGVAAMMPDENSQINELVNRADAALYEAKRTGRAKVIVATEEAT